MLVLSRKPGEKIMIGTDICITVVAVDIYTRKTKLAIEAPRSVPVWRTELLPLTQAHGAAQEGVPS